MDFSLWLFVIIITGVIVYNLFFTEKAIIKRKLKKASTKPLSQFKNEDVAKIVGKIHLVDAPLIAPLSKRECGYYFVHVEKKVSSGKNSTWKTLIKEYDFNTYLINDGGYYALINTGNIKTHIVDDKNYTSGLWEGSTQNLETFLSARGYESQGFLGFHKTIRYAEGILEKGEQVAVYGKGVWKNAKALGLPEKYGKVLEITPPENETVFLSDDPSTTLKKHSR